MRKAAALIELIFAIAVLGVALSALPMLFTQVRHATNFTLAQEAVAMAAANVDAAMSFTWDQVNTKEEYNSFILETGGSDLFAKQDGSWLRGDRDKFSPTRRFSTTDTLTASSVMGADSDGAMNDVDDFDGREITLTVPDEADKNDYVMKEIKVKITVAYWEFEYSFAGGVLSAAPKGAAAGTTNSKKITAEFSTTHKSNLKTSMYGYSFNTGGYHVETAIF